LLREAALAVAAAATISSLLAWNGPPGGDLAAHVYQRSLFLQHGFVLWNNLWYAGRYSFVTYSLLYYPLAGLLGIRLLAVATITVATLAFAVIVARQWGPAARWSSRTFGVVWAGLILTAAFPFALGAALALLAVWAIQAGRIGRFAVLAPLVLAASPVAFLLLTIALTAFAIGKRLSSVVRAGVVVVMTCWLAEAALYRLFGGDGRYPFSFTELVAALTFCAVATALSWRVASAESIRWLFPVYAGACALTYLVPSGVGENVARLRYLAIPIAVLVLTFRRWRPLPLCVTALAGAIAWNTSPLVASFLSGSSDPSSGAAYWAPAVDYLHQHLGRDYRVEAVDTQGHWEAYYLPRARIPIVRGWFRQDDFPENALLYAPLNQRSYLRWLHALGVRYVLLTDTPPDYSAIREAALLREIPSLFHVVFRSAHTLIYAVPSPEPLLTGPARPTLAALTDTVMTFKLHARGIYRIAVRYSRYWQPSLGCLRRDSDGMMLLTVPRSGTALLRFSVSLDAVVGAVTGGDMTCAGRATTAATSLRKNSSLKRASNVSRLVRP
jgi:hypothetical protein